MTDRQKKRLIGARAFALPKDSSWDSWEVLALDGLLLDQKVAKIQGKWL